MNRTVLLGLASLAAVLATGGPPVARADRLGGNYRGPDDVYEVKEDPAPPPAPPAGEDGDTDDGTGNVPEAGEGSAGGGETQDGGSAPPPPPPPQGGNRQNRGPASDTPADSGGGEDAPPPDSGGGRSGDGEASSPPEGGSEPSGPATSTGTGGASAGPAKGGGVGGKGGSHDDRDRIWPFYFEGAKEEYLVTVLARRGGEKISPRGSSTWLLSDLPEPRLDRRPVGDGDRREAFDLVLARLRDPDSHVRDAAVLALGKSGSPDALPWLERAAERDPDAAVREDALLALGLTRRPEALPALLDAIASPDATRGSRTAYAALGLGLLGRRDEASEPLRALYAATAAAPDRADEAVAAATALGMLGDELALPLFERVLASRTASETVRAYTLHAMGKFGALPEGDARRRAFEGLRAALGMRKEVKRSALLALGGFADAATVPLLAKEGIEDPDEHCRIFAAHALGRIAGRAGPGSREHALVQDALTRFAEKDRRDRWLFQAGNVALAAMAGADREKTLLELAAEMRSLNLNSASSVVVSLGLSGAGSPAAAGRLRAAFEDRSGGAAVRGYAGLALAMAGTPGTADLLSGSLRSEDPAPGGIARASALGLGLVGGAKEADLLVDVIAGRAGGRREGGERFFLLGAAVQGLGIIGDGDSVARLRPLLEPRTPWETRAFATAALGYVLETDAAHRVAPRISSIFRHHNYLVGTPLVRAVQSTL